MLHNVSHISKEFSEKWMENHPDLFVKSLHEVHVKAYEHGLFIRKVDRSRKGFITYHWSK